MTVRRRARSPRGSGEILADEIIEAAGELLTEQGDADAVSIRAVANRVGVTPPSIYLHFEDKNALLDAVCARYFEQIDAEFERATEGIDDPMDRALELGLTYIRFALSTPVLYRVAFRDPIGEHLSKVDEVLAASAYARFTKTVSDLADQGLFAQEDVADIVLEFWGTAHGIASLMLAKPALPWGDGLRHAENMLRSVCVGRAVLRLVGEDVEPAGLRTWLQSAAKQQTK